MDSSIVNSSHLPLFASAPICLIYIALLTLFNRHNRSLALSYVLFAISARLIISVFHYATFASSPLGISWNALATIAIAGLGLLVVRRRFLTSAGMVPMYCLAGLIVLSGIANAEPMDMIAVLAKYTYFATLLLALADALEDVGVDRAMKAILGALSLLLVIQLVGAALGVVKANEADGSASYVGGLFHEAPFSIGLAAALVALCFIRSMPGWAKVMFFLWCTAAIVLANYRTTILAIAPLLAVTAITGTTRRFVEHQRPLIMGFMLVSVTLVGTLAISFGSERYQDLFSALSSETEIIRPTEDFTIEDRRLMSGRSFIWSQYIEAYNAGTPLQKLVGFGAESWDGRFRVYAHNTLVSTLYELGVLGVIAMLYLWITMFVLALRAPAQDRGRLIAAHVSFAILAQATMPMWMLEGLILYALICGYTLYAAGQRSYPRDTSEPSAAPSLSPAGT